MDTAVAVKNPIQVFFPGNEYKTMSSASVVLPPCFAVYQRLGFQVVSGNMSWDASLKDGAGGKAVRYDGGSWVKSEKFPSGGQLNFTDKDGYFKSCFALRTGKVSGCWAMDIDDPELEHNKRLIQMAMPVCNMIARTRRGLHFIFKYDERIKSTASHEKAIDIQVDGKLLYVSPSRYKPKDEDMFQYEWITTPDEEEPLNPISDELLEELSEVMGWQMEEDEDEPEEGFGSASGDEKSELSDKKDTTPPREQNKEENKKMIEALLMAVDVKHLTSYSDWIRCGFICYNEGVPFEVFDKASKRAKNYDKKGVASAWASITKSNARDKRLKQRRLWDWLRVDNPTKYVELMKKRDDFFVFLECVNHAEVAQMFYDLRSDSFVYHNVQGWYEINKYNVWEPHGQKIPPNMVNMIWESLKHLAMEHLPYINPFSKDPVERKKADNLLNFRKVIGNNMFCKGVVGFLPTFYYYEDLPNVMDESRHLFAFSDKVFDLNALEFRDIKADDWVCLTTGYKAPVEVDKKAIKKVKDTVATMFHDEAMTDYVLSELMIHLHGDGQRQYQRFNIWTGSGGNGKGVLADTIKASFGKYYITLPITILTQPSDKKDAPCPKLAEAKGCRIAMAQEPESACNLQGGLIKDLTGDGEIVARALYSNPITYRPQFGLFLQCNNIPNIKLDGGVERRFCITPFPYQFVPNPTRKTERKGDPFIKEYMVSNEARDAFILLLINKYKKWIGDKRPNPLFAGSYVPTNTHIAEATSGYIQSNNALDDWLKNKWTITNSNTDLISARECYISYKEDRSSDPSMKELSEVIFAQLMTYNKIGVEKHSSPFSRTDDDGVVTQYKCGKYYTGIKKLPEGGATFIDDE